MLQHISTEGTNTGLGWRQKYEEMTSRVRVVEWVVLDGASNMHQTHKIVSKAETPKSVPIFFCMQNSEQAPVGWVVGGDWLLTHMAADCKGLWNMPRCPFTFHHKFHNTSYAHIPPRFTRSWIFLKYFIVLYLSYKGKLKVNVLWVFDHYW